jgi:hypothetical protein
MVLSAATAARMVLSVATAAPMELSVATAARMVLDRIVQLAMPGDQRQLLHQNPSAAANSAHRTGAENSVAESGLHRPHQQSAEHPCAEPNHRRATADWGASVDCEKIQMIRLRAVIPDQAVYALRHHPHRSRGLSSHDRMDDSTNDHRRHAAGIGHRHLHLDHRELFRAPSWAANPFAS